MRNFKIIATLLITIVLFSGCSKDEEVERLVGTWNVTAVTISARILNIPVTETDNSPVGTITFSKPNKGAQNYTFKFLGTTQVQVDDFTWKVDGAYIVTGGDDNWERLINEENKQQVKFQDIVSATDIRTYTLTFEK